MKPKRIPIPTTEVLEWLRLHQPHLHAVAEVERNWLWLPVDLRGDNNKPIREAIKEYGFRFAKRGHLLPSGKLGTWAHSCTVPLPFIRKPKGSSNPKSQQQHEPASNSTPEGAEGVDIIDPELAAFLQS